MNAQASMLKCTGSSEPSLLHTQSMDVDKDYQNFGIRFWLADILTL